MRVTRKDKKVAQLNRWSYATRSEQLNLSKPVNAYCFILRIMHLAVRQTFCIKKQMAVTFHMIVLLYFNLAQ